MFQSSPLSVLYSDSGLSRCWPPTLSDIWKTPPSCPGSQVWPAPAYSALEATPLREGRGHAGFFSLPTWLPASYPVQRSAGAATPHCLSRTESLWFQGGRGVRAVLTCAQTAGAHVVLPLRSGRPVLPAGGGAPVPGEAPSQVEARPEDAAS